MYLRPDSPFSLDNEHQYQIWRTEKLADYPRSKNDLIVPINDPAKLSIKESEALRKVCARTNFAIYSTKTTKHANRSAIRNLCTRLGLVTLDSHLYADDGGVSAITNTADRQQGEYIPYTTLPIGWHTDGYYNKSEQQINGMVLHCVNPAGASGGENMLLDHEIAYLLMRDENPDMVAALMQADAFTVPANVVEGKTLRQAVSGPVFSVNNNTGALHMRYSARQRNIQWKNDPMTQAGADFLMELWKSPPPYVFYHRMAAGEGLVSNNILHGRTAFEDDDNSAARLLYRARSYDRIVGTDFRNYPDNPGKISAHTSRQEYS